MARSQRPRPGNGIEQIAPERILSVHTQRLDWFEERWPKRVIVARYGEAVRLG